MECQVLAKHLTEDYSMKCPICVLYCYSVRLPFYRLTHPIIKHHLQCYHPGHASHAVAPGPCVFASCPRF